MFTKIPQKSALEAMGNDALVELRNTVKSEIETALAAEPVSTDVLAAVKDANAGRALINTVIKERNDAAAAASSARDEFMKSEDVVPMSDPTSKDDDETTTVETGGDSEHEPVVTDPTSDDTGAGGDDNTAGGDTADGDATGGDSADGNGSLADRGLGGTRNTGGAPRVEPPVSSPTSGFFKSTGKWGGLDAGHTFDDWTHIAEALTDTVEMLGENPTGKHVVGRINAAFADWQKTSEDPVANFLRFQSEEVTAALAVPAQPIYDVGCDSSAARPVKGSLQTLEAERGKVSTYSSPTLADITDAANATNTPVGIWTSADDTNASSIKGFTEVAPGVATDYEIYAVYRQMRVQELLLRTFPELVAAWLNKLVALHSRTGEVQLLNSMAAGSIPLLDPAAQGYGASVAIFRRLLEMLIMHRDQERWGDEVWDLYLPRWTVGAMRLDQMSRNTYGGIAKVPTEADVKRQFADLGFNLIPFMDDASWSIANADLNDGGTLGTLPSTAKMIVTRPGKFKVMDKGMLQVGVMATPQRDSVTIGRNQAVMFMENFEGLVDTDTCPAYLMTVGNLRYSGHQIADLILEADGTVPIAA